MIQEMGLFIHLTFSMSSSIPFCKMHKIMQGDTICLYVGNKCCDLGSR